MPTSSRVATPVFSIIDELDLDQQTAITTLALAISRGGGAVNDPLELPAPPDTEPAGSVPELVQLPNQIRGRGLMTYDDATDGFSGNYDNPDPECAIINVVGAEARPAAMDHALSNSFGFGGTNVSLLLSRV